MRLGRKLNSLVEDQMEREGEKLLTFRLHTRPCRETFFFGKQLGLKAIKQT